MSQSQSEMKSSEPREESKMTRTGEMEQERLRQTTPSSVETEKVQVETKRPHEKIESFESLPSRPVSGTAQVTRQPVSATTQVTRQPVSVPIQTQGLQYQQQFPVYQQTIYQPQMLYPTQQYTQIVSDPTIQLFNRLVAKDTHCLLGRTGLKVSRICLGSLNFGKLDSNFGERPEQLDENEAHKILDRYVNLGGNIIDTADFYPWFGNSSGESERIIGNWLQNQEREKICIITKLRMPIDPDNVNSGGLSRSHIIDSVNCSLKRLKTDYVDFLVLNGWDPTVNVYETVRHLSDLVHFGKVRYIGVCDFKGWQLQKFIDASKVLNLHKCVCYMGEYNLLTRGCEWEIMDVCKNERIGFFAYSPFKYGFLTNQYTSSTNRPVEGSRIEAASAQPNLAAMAEPFEEMKRNPIYTNVLSVCERIGNRRNLTTAQIAILWALQKGFVTSVVVGCNSVKELEENMNCLTGDLVLTPEDMLELEQASSFRLQYPYNINLSSVAGIKEIQPFWSAPFEQLSLMAQQMNLEQTRQIPSETLHEAKGQFFPEQESLRQPQIRSEQQRTIF